MKIILDVDGTVYSYHDTHFEQRIIALIHKYMVEKLSIPEAEVEQLAQAYFVKYGLASTGLYKYHNVNLEEFCRYIHDVDYSRLTRDERLIATLQHIKDEGHELWIMTNADMPHAQSVLDKLEITPFFTNKSGELRGFDCFLQWGHSEPKMQNKPMRGAYEALHRMMDPSLPHGDVVMVDDAFANLEEPHRLGWKTIWISHDRTWPESATFKPDMIASTVHDIDALLSTVTNETDNNKSTR